LARGSPRASFLLLLTLAGLLSAVLNNTPVVVLMIPLVVTVARRTGRSPSRYLMAISFAAMLGGTMTLVGTSTNLVGSQMANRLGYEPLTLFSFLPVGIVVFLVGLVALFLLGPRLTPARRQLGEASERFGLQDYRAEVDVLQGSSLVGKSLDDSQLRYGYDVEVLRIYRGGRPVVTDPATLELAPGDVLLLHAAPDELVRLLEDDLVDPVAEGTTHTLEEAGNQLFEVTVGKGLHVRGRTLAETRFRQRYGALVLGIKRGERTFRDRLHEIPLAQGDTLLLLGDAMSQRAIARSREFILSEDAGVEPYREEKKWLAVAIFAGVLVAAGAGWTVLPVAALTGVLAMGLTGCIRAYEIFEAVDWEVILVLVGLVPLGVAFVSSGASDLVASTISSAVGPQGPIVLLAAVYVATFVLTQIVTNAAAVTIMVPVGARLAEALMLEPMAFIMAAIFAGSAGFLTPIGYQTNLMVYGPGEYRFTDFLRLGLPMALLVGVATLFMVAWVWPLAG
ncbi:MAG: SLC13 family permease, partial [Candidatus Thermoplasmatota archaeon]|nr:SLC13 family permease [Candidatus Thermoplasmatota archaeon]